MSKAKIYYHDIGDYLSREEKLATLKKYGSVKNIPWETLTPNEHGDWLNQRNDVFGSFIAIGDKDDTLNKTIFNPLYSRGISTARDAWCYNSSENKLENNIQITIDFYNVQREAFIEAKKVDSLLKVDDFITYDSTKISWNRGFKQDMNRGKIFSFEKTRIFHGIYRPFFKQHLYFSRDLNDMTYQMPKLYPNVDINNRVICVSGIGSSKDFSTVITDCVPDLQFQFNGQVFPLYYYEERPKQQKTLFDTASEGELMRRDGVSDFIFTQAWKAYGLSTGSRTLGKEDIFYYVYGFLHCPEYRIRFANDLKKMLPRIPLVDETKDFWAFSKAGRKLAELHINYETVPAFDGVRVVQSGLDFESNPDYYHVEKMRFPRKDQKDTIFYNGHITIENIPAEAYEYVVNGKSAIEWIMERYQITTHKESGIRNNSNDWATEVGNPRYILDLLLSIINVSVQTVEVVKGLPEVRF